MTCRLYVEPSCPFSWVTARWLSLACATTGEPFAVGALSLHLVNRDRDDVPGEFAARQLAGIGVLRAMEHARGIAGDAAATALYLEAGRRFHIGGDHRFDQLGEAVVAAGLPEEVAAASHDPNGDTALKDLLDELAARLGGEVASPLLSLDESGRLLKGPILQAVPDVDHAVELLAALRTLSVVGEFSQVAAPMRSPVVPS